MLRDGTCAADEKKPEMDPPISFLVVPMSIYVKPCMANSTHVHHILDSSILLKIPNKHLQLSFKLQSFTGPKDGKKSQKGNRHMTWCLYRHLVQLPLGLPSNPHDQRDSSSHPVASRDINKNH